MQENDILIAFTKLVADETENPSLSLGVTDKPHEVEDWDSILNIQLIVAAEKHFGIKFQTSDIATFRTVGDWVNCIKGKLGN